MRVTSGIRMSWAAQGWFAYFVTIFCHLSDENWQIGSVPDSYTGYWSGVALDMSIPLTCVHRP